MEPGQDTVRVLGPVQIVGPSKAQLPITPGTDCDDVKGVTKTMVWKVSAGTGKTPVEKVLSAFVFPDNVIEGAETFTIVLSNPVGATIRDGCAVFTIADDD